MKTVKKRKKPAGRSRTGEVIVGKLSGNSKGFGFLLCESGDLFIAPDAMGGARHGDTVKAVRLPGTDNARVVEVLSRRFNAIPGVYYEDGGRCYVAPEDKHFGTLEVRRGGAKTGDRVMAALHDDGHGEVTEVLAADGAPDIRAILGAFGLETRFPRNVLKEADLVAAELTEADLNGREDFRDQLTFTIDGDDSRDFDDAVSIKKTAGGYILGVHIADVSHYVKKDSALDKEAFKRGTSVYFADTTVHMLPEDLSCGVCSLSENDDRLTLSAIMHMDKSGAVTKHSVCESVIASKARLTYKKAQAILDGDERLCEQYKALVPSLKSMAELAAVLTEKRRERGAVEIDSAETEFVMDGGKVKDIRRAESLFTHKIIEEFMILANETVARHFCLLKVPFVYRTHEVPPVEKVDKLKSFLGYLGINFNPEGEVKPADFAGLLQGVDGDTRPVVGRMVLRSMSKAEYRPECKGHFGLSLQYYCHFTSPIRRYPDLLIHRIIKEQLRGGSVKRFTSVVGEASNQSSKKEREAEEAERKANDMYVASYMRGHIGEVYSGVVSGVTEWGVFVMLDNTAEGLIRIESLGGGYAFNEDALTLSGQHIFRLGQRLNVRVDAVNGDKIDFTLAE